MTNLERAYAEATEWNLATLSGLLERKSSPKYEIKRQRSICVDIVSVPR